MEIHRVGPFPDPPPEAAPTEAAPARETSPLPKGIAEEGRRAPVGDGTVAGDDSAARAAESRLVESRQDAWHLKSELQARFKASSDPHALLGHPADSVSRGNQGDPLAAESKLVKDVTDYLHQHPEAADTQEGVGEWWSGLNDAPGLDARGEEVGIGEVVIQTEGWTPEPEDTADPAGSSQDTPAENRLDDMAEPSRLPPRQHEDPPPPGIPRSRRG